MATQNRRKTRLASLIALATSALLLSPGLVSISHASVAPSIISISPTSGTAAGGTTVTVSGTDFDPALTQVRIDGVSVTPSSVTSTSLTFATPVRSLTARSVGAKPIVIETPSGISSEVIYFTYRPLIDLGTKNQSLVVLNNLSSRSNAGAITRSSVAPWSVTGTDSLSGDSYSYTFGKASASQYPSSSAVYSSESYETAKAGLNLTGGTWSVAAGTKADLASINLSSSVNCSSFGNFYRSRSTYCSVFGPEVYSEAFYARAGQALSFNWIAEGGSDHYEVYAFLVAVTDNTLTSTPADNQHTLLAHGMGAIESSWKTSSGNIPADGLYRFRFVNGSYDYSGGKALGANMFVDQTITVGDANAITFPVVGDQIGSSGTFTHPLTSTSGVAVSLATSTSGVCSVSTSHSGTSTTATITKNSAGTCVLTASQGASGMFAPAAQVTRAFEIRTSAIAPFAPTIVSILAENAQLRINFNVPDRDGGSSITNYQYSTDGSTWVTPSPSVTASPLVVSGLTNGTSYPVRIRAVNSVGSGTVSSVVSGIPQPSIPDAPTISAVTSGDQSLSVAFVAPLNNGGSSITNYQYSTDGSTWVTPSPSVTASPMVISGLTNGTSYPVRIRAVNSVGSGAVSNIISATPISIGGGGSSTTASPTPAPTPSPTPAPTPSTSPRLSSRPPVIANGPTASSSQSPAAAEQLNSGLKPIPMIIPEMDVTPGISFSADNPIPQDVVKALLSPLAYSASTSGSSPQLPELTPSQSMVYENGIPTEAQMVVSSRGNGYVLSGSSWQVVLESTDDAGEPKSLDETGNVVLDSDRFIRFQGTGFAPGTIIKVWLFSEPSALATIKADSAGNFQGGSQLPNGVPVGQHTVQLNGLSQDGQIRSVALGVVVKPSIAAVPIPAPIESEPAWNQNYAVAGLVLLLPLVLLSRIRWIVLAFRRREREEERAHRKVRSAWAQG